MSALFDLEKAPAAWRHPFEHDQTFSREDLEELENGLRDRVEALVAAGLAEEAAFREAVRRVGTYAVAETEYRKVYWGIVKRRHRRQDELHRRLSMLKNYLTVAYRMLVRQKGYAFLNMFGLAANAAEQRTKEVGVRKVLGASVMSVVALLSKDFLKLVGFAFVVAVPLAYFAMQHWLEDFAYRIELGPGLFLLAGGIAFLIALLAVSSQSVKAALADPVESLRYE